MSARKIDANSFAKTDRSTQCLTLPPSAVRIRKNGIEFRHSKPIETWTEMKFALEGPGDTGKIECQGVIVACDGNQSQGYTISMLFTTLTAESRARLLAYA